MLTESGVVRGAASSGVVAFKGIPFTAPRTGDKRWHLPEKLDCFPGGLKVASDFGPVCPQYSRADGGVVGDEDCLTLNVWAPANAAPGSTPVLFFVHGGAHEEGSASGDVYDGLPLARDRGVVVVTAEYRLGPFGFLAHPALSTEGGQAKSGDYGMHDQIAALQWVHDNIAGFGGDPAHVLLFGESAGAVSVCRLMVSPLAAGLFASAAMESGACVARALADAEQKGLAIANRVGCTDPSQAATCLRGLTTAQVMAGFDPVANGTGQVGQANFDGVIDGYAVPDAPRTLMAAGTFNVVPIIVNSNTDESGKDTPAITTEAEFRAYLTAFLGGLATPTLLDQIEAQYPASAYNNSWRKAAVAATTDAKFTCSARTDARLFAQHSAKPTYRSLFGDTPDQGGVASQAHGAFHGSELLYVFGTLAELYPTLMGSGDTATITAMQSAWSAMASTGAPQVAGSPAWPTYAVANEQLMFFQNGTQVLASDPRGTNCDFWDSLHP